MIVCPNCKTRYIENTLFCEECGDYLSGGEVPKTNPVGTRILSDARLRSPDLRAALNPSGSMLPIISLIIEQGREIAVRLEKAIHMGRLDPISNMFPEIDLTEDGGFEKGVSRRHARILRRENEFFVEDLGSTNGTFINGEKISPFHTEPITDGDSLRLGNLQIEVHLQAI
jgi:hypothetical protein